MVQAATEFRKSGFSDEDSAILARIASMYQNVADESISAGESASFIIAQMKAFGIEAENSEHIIDAINEVSNNFAVSSSDLAGTLGIVSANMANVGNSYEQTLGMMTAITEVTRNSSKAARGLNSITSRLIQTLDAESSTGKKLKAIYEELGIALFDQNGQLRNSFEIFKELSQQWGSLSTNQREYIALTSAGANQVQNFTALMSNFDQAVAATETAVNSQGSALHENERVMESLEAKTNLLKATFQDLANNVITNDMVKAILDLGNNFLNLVNNPVGIAIIRFGLVTGTLIGFLTIAVNVGGKIIGLTKSLFGFTAAAEAAGTAGVAAGAGAKAMGAGFLSAHPVILAVAAALGVAAAAYGAWMDSEKKEAQVQEARLNENANLLQKVKNRLTELEEVPVSQRNESWQNEYDNLEHINKQLEERIRLIKEANNTPLNPVVEDSDENEAKQRRDKGNLITYIPRVSYSVDLSDTPQPGSERGPKYVYSQYAKEVKEFVQLIQTTVSSGLVKSSEDWINTIKDSSLVLKADIEFEDGATLEQVFQTIQNKLGNDVLDVSLEVKDTDVNELMSIIDTLSDKFKNLDGKISDNSEELQVEATVLNDVWFQLKDYVDILKEAQQNGASLTDAEKKAVRYVREHESTIGLLGSTMYDTNDTLTKLNQGLSVSGIELSGLLTVYPKLSNYLDSSTGKLELSSAALIEGALAGDKFALSILELNKALAETEFNALEAKRTHAEEILSNRYIGSQTEIENLLGYSPEEYERVRTAYENANAAWDEYIKRRNLGGGGTGGGSGSSTKKDPIQTQYNAYKKLLDAQKDIINLRKKEGASDEELIGLWQELSKQAEGYGQALQKQFNLSDTNEYFVKLKTSVIDFNEEARSLQKSMLDTTLNDLTGRISWFETNGWDSAGELNSAVKRWEAYIQAITDAYKEGILTKKEYDEKLLTANDSLFSAKQKEFTDRLTLSDEYISDRNNWDDWVKFLDPRDGSVDTLVKAYERVVENIDQAYKDGLITAKEYYDKLETYSLKLRDARRTELDDAISEVEDYISERNDLNDWGTDNESKQYAKLNAEIKKRIDEGTVDFEYGMKKRNEIAKKYNKALLDEFNDTLDKISDAYDELVETAENDADEYKDDIQDLADIAQARLDDIQDQLDTIDEKWDAELEALEKSNDELDKQIQKEEALNDLAKARSKKVLVYKDGRFQYINDADEISSAQQKLDELQRKEQLEAQKEAIEEKRKAKKKDLEDEKAHLEKYIKYWNDFLRDYDIQTKKANVISKNLWDGQSKNWKQGLIDLKSYIDEYKKKMEEYNKAVESQNVWQNQVLPNLNDPSKLTTDYVENSDLDDFAKEQLYNEIIKQAQGDFYNATTEYERIQANNKANEAREKLGIATSQYSGDWNKVIEEAKQEFANATTEAERKAANAKANEARDHLGLPQEVYGGTSSNSSSSSTAKNAVSSSRSSSRSSAQNTATAVANVVGTVLPKTVTTTMGAVGLAVGTVLNNVLGAFTKNANGTYDAMGGLSLVGEHGPELRVLSHGDGVVPAGATKNLFEWGKTTPKEFMAGITSKNDTLSQMMSINIQNLNLPSVQNGEDFVAYMRDNFWRTTVQHMASN